MQNVHELMSETATRALSRNPELLKRWNDLPSFVEKYSMVEKTLETKLNTLREKQFKEIEECLKWNKQSVLDQTDLLHDRPQLEEHKEYRKKQNAFKKSFKNILRQIDEAVKKVYPQPAGA